MTDIERPDLFGQRESEADIIPLRRGRLPFSEHLRRRHQRREVARLIQNGDADVRQFVNQCQHNRIIFTIPYPPQKLQRAPIRDA